MRFSNLRDIAELQILNIIKAACEVFLFFAATHAPNFITLISHKHESHNHFHWQEEPRYPQEYNVQQIRTTIDQAL